MRPYLAYFAWLVALVATLGSLFFSEVLGLPPCVLCWYQRIAMGAGGSDTALETADVALVADDLMRVPWVLDLSRQAARTIKFNIGMALATKAAVAILAVFGLANLWMAIGTDVGATVLVILNGMRLLGGVSTDAPADATASRARYGLGKEDPHAGHAH